MANHKVKSLIAIIFVSGLCTLFASCSQNVKQENDVKKTRVAMCQILCIDSDREGNFVRIENALIGAKTAGADIACFPETSILGWVNPNAHELACPIPGKDSHRLCQLAKKYGMFISIGLSEKQDEKLYDSAILVSSEGEILLKHRKINTLDFLMDKPYSRGNSVNAVETQFGRIGMLICADTFMSENLEKMKQQSPDILLVPYGWADDKEKWPEHGKTLESLVSHVAGHIGCALIGTDVVGGISGGPWTGKVYGGQSVAADKNGKILGRCCDRDVDMEIVTIDCE